MYAIVVFFHVMAALAFAALLALEWVSDRRLWGAKSYEEARGWTTIWPLMPVIGMPSTLVILASGIYLASESSVWIQAWVRLAIPIAVVLAVAGASLAGRRKRMLADLASGTGDLPEALRARLRDGVSLASWRFRAVMLVALILEMTTRPDAPEAYWEAGAATVLGILWGLPGWKGAPVSQATVART